MAEKIAFELVQQYIKGWKQNNLKMILSSLDENCLVIESHGPTYHGVYDIELWFNFWLEAKSKITIWDIRSFSYCDTKKIAFCEWDFSCISNNIEYTLPGISLVKFSAQKINFIHEYRMARAPYKWERNKLQSE